MSVLVVGLGISGQAALRFLQAQGDTHIYAYDTRPQFDLTQLRLDFPQVSFAQGKLPVSWASKVQMLVLSPGIDPKSDWVLALVEQGVTLVGEIELFCRSVAADKSIIAITGSNGKSTVTTLVGELLSAHGYAVAVGGNLGTPALDLLQQDDVDIYVLELSSFQLETTQSLVATTAAILNISADHLDRYGDMANYIAAKAPLYHMTDIAVVNTDDVIARRLAEVHPQVVSFSLSAPQDVGHYGIVQQDGVTYLAEQQVDGLQLWAATTDIALVGRHNWSNCLAALALCKPFDLQAETVIGVFSRFTGLPYRAQLIRECAGVRWVNDSKGTNVDSTMTALHSLGADAPIVLLAGGQAKGQSFVSLRQAINDYARAVILFGVDASLIAADLDVAVPMIQVDTLTEAIQQAQQCAQVGDVVLLSPACASFDQFRDYTHRGDVFAHQVLELICNG